MTYLAIASLFITRTSSLTISISLTPLNVFLLSFIVSAAVGALTVIALCQMRTCRIS